jgi:hypothetical protein
MGVSVGKFAVVGMASFDLVLFEWLRGVQARDCGDSGVLYAIVVGLVLGVWCLVLGAWFWISSIPSVSAAEDFLCWLAGAVGCKVKISGVFFGSLLVVCFRLFVLSFRCSPWFDFVWSEVCVGGSSTSFADVM